MSLGFFGSKRRWLVRIELLAICMLLYVLPYFSYIKAYASDPELTLLVSQTILEQGTVKLDRYRGEMVLGRPFEEFIHSPKILQQNGHIYSYFPTGPAILALPVVAVARMWGWDMSRVSGNYVLQGYLAAFSVVAVFLIIYKTARLYLGEQTSLFIGLTAVLGSTVVSTMGTALWSINFATIFVALSLYLLARGPDSWAWWTPFALGVLLFLGFFARVSTAAFIAPVLLYLAIYQPKKGLITAVTALFFLILFLTWSRLEFGQWLPAYYSVARLAVVRAGTWVGVYGNLLSPSRGIFVFSPFFILGVLGAFVCWRGWRQRPLMPVILLWFILLLLVIARGSSWWGGASFGPRLLTEIVPGLALLVILVWAELSSSLSQSMSRWGMIGYALLAVLAMGIHGFQGLYNSSAARWNSLIDPLPLLPGLGLGDLFNWQYSQVLASPDWNCEIIEDRTAAFLEQLPIFTEYEWGEEMRYYEAQFLEATQSARLQAEVPLSGAGATFESSSRLFLPYTPDITTQAIFTGLVERPGATAAESHCHDMTIFFHLGEMDGAPEALTLVLTAASKNSQRLVLYVNGTLAAEQNLAQTGDEVTAVTFTVPTTLLHFEGLNELRIELPDAAFTGFRDSTYRGLRFDYAVLFPAEMDNLYPIPPPTHAYP